MTKGFTVKAKRTEPSSDAIPDQVFDKEQVLRDIKGKSIVFCLPGRGVSYAFLKSFVQLCFDLVHNGASIQISQDYSSMVNFARCKCLGANVLQGPDQLPWQGKLEYDYQMWIDSDIVFNSDALIYFYLSQSIVINIIRSPRRIIGKFQKTRLVIYKTKIII